MPSPNKKTGINSPCCCIVCKKTYSSAGINYHYVINHTLNGPSSQSFIEERKRKAIEYYVKPKLCKHCNNVIPYHKKENTFCGPSCSAKHCTPKRPPRSIESRLKTSIAISNKPKSTSVRFHECELCKKTYILSKYHTNKSKRFCSKECLHIHRSNIARHNPGLGTKRSKDEITLFELCKSHFNSVEPNKKLVNGWDADIVIFDLKVAILWNGPWHYQEMNIGNHSLTQVQNRDAIKIKEFINAGWQVLVFEDRYYTPLRAFEELKSLPLND